MPVDDNESLAGLAAEPPATEPAALSQAGSESLPVNEADDDVPGVTSTEAVVDELGLPVAMESPPADLIPAVPTVGTPSLDNTAGVTQPGLPPAGDVTLSSAMPSAVPTTSPSVSTDLVDNAGDLSGLTDESDDAVSPVSPTPAPVVSGDTGLPATSNGGFSGVASPQPPSAPTFSQAPSTPTFPQAPSTPVYPAADTPAPGSSLPDVYAYTPSLPPEYSVATPTAKAPSPAAAPPPVVSQPPAASFSTPSAAVPGVAGSAVAAMPTARIESFGGIAAEAAQVKPEDILPEDATTKVTVTNVIPVQEAAKAERDEAITAAVSRYVGRERRDNLDKEIERLYNEVATELSANADDTKFALTTLRDAQNLVFEDPREYDEALYLVKTVQAMLVRKRNVRRWSYTWGMFIFIYAVIWLILFMAGFVLNNTLSAALPVESDAGVRAVLAAWFSALAGGIGGTVGILYSLYWRVAVKQDFDRQYVMNYLVQPIMGFILGAVIYFIIAAGFLFINFASDPATNESQVLASPTIIAFQVLLGWIAGFRQRFVFETIDKIVQRFSSKPPDSQATVITTDTGKTSTATVVETEVTTTAPVTK